MRQTRRPPRLFFHIFFFSSLTILSEISVFSKIPPRPQGSPRLISGPGYGPGLTACLKDDNVFTFFIYKLYPKFKSFRSVFPSFPYVYVHAIEIYL